VAAAVRRILAVLIALRAATNRRGTAAHVIEVSQRA
jgi:hypothetical protein